MLAAIIFKKEPFFHGSSNFNQLERIAKVLGTDDLVDYVEKFQVDFADIDKISNYKRKSWSSFVLEENMHLANYHAIDLLDKMLI